MNRVDLVAARWSRQRAAINLPIERDKREVRWPENPMLTLVRAYHFAAVRHVEQRRKGDAAEPYVNHLTEVAELAARATRGTDPEIIVAAVLHDTVEDTEATFAELEARSARRRAGPRGHRRQVADKRDPQGAAGRACGARLASRPDHQAGRQDLERALDGGQPAERLER